MVAVPSSEVEAAAAAAGIDGGAVTAGEAGEEEEFELEDALVDGELGRRSQSAGEPRLVDGEGCTVRIASTSIAAGLAATLRSSMMI